MGCQDCTALNAGSGYGTDAIANAGESRQRLTYALVHVVVLVRRQPADEVHVRRRLRERLVTGVQRRVLGPRYRVVRVTLSARELAHDRRAVRALAGEVLELGRAR